MNSWIQAPRPTSTRSSLVGAARRGLAFVLSAFVLFAGLPAANALTADIVPETATQRFVRHAYGDLLDRTPSAGDVSHWSTILRNGTPRLQVANAFTSSDEYRTTMIRGSYQSYLLRTPDAGGIAGWLHAMRTGMTLTSIETGFLASAEYYASAGGTKAGWIRRLYDDVLHRTASSGDVTNWNRALRAGTSRATIARAFLLSTEHLNSVVDGHYRHLLNRPVDSSGRTTWVRLLQRGAREETVVGRLVASAEYWTKGDPLDRLVLTPVDATITPGGHQTYTARGFDAHDYALGDVTDGTTFSLDGDTCTGATCTSSDLGDHTVTATNHGATGTATLTVTVGALHHLVLLPATQTITAGETQTYTAEGFDAHDNTLGDVTDTTTFDVDGDSCTGATCTTSDTGDHIVTGTNGTATGTATLTVEAGALHHLVLSPATQTITAGETQTYTAEGFDAHDNTLGDVTSSTTFDVDSVICTGATCAPTDAGDHAVTGTNSTATGTGTLTVEAGALHHLVLSPATQTIATGESQTYTAEGFDAHDNSRGDVTSSTVFDVDGDTSQCAAATCTLAHSGTFTINGTSATRTGTADLLVLDIGYGAYGWGMNSNGQLGDGSTTDRSTPVSTGSDSFWRTLSAGDDHRVATRTDGTLWAWGSNVFGQLGDGTTGGRRLTPGQVGTGTAWAAAAAGNAHSVGIETDGTLWAWGANWNGQLGDGTTTDRTTPTQIGTDTDWASVVAGAGYTAALKTDGTLWAWGSNWSGKLGDGTTTDRTAPTQIGTSTDWATVVAGVNHTAGIRTDGTLWIWGLNNNGQLGDNTTTRRTAPTLLSAGAGWASVGLGEYSTTAVQTDGTLWGWGQNAHGNLGNGTTTSSRVPVQAGTDTDWASVAAGAFHSVGIKTGRTLWAWGYDQFGQVGNGSGDGDADSVSPVQVGNATDWVRASAGAYSSYALRGTGPAIDHLVLTPATATVTLGTSQTYVATGVDVYGNSRIVTADTTFDVDGDDSLCTGATCTPTAVGASTVTGTLGAATGTATLTVDAVVVGSYEAWAWGSSWSSARRRQQHRPGQSRAGQLRNGVGVDRGRFRLYGGGRS